MYCYRLLSIYLMFLEEKVNDSSKLIEILPSPLFVLVCSINLLLTLTLFNADHCDQKEFTGFLVVVEVVFFFNSPILLNFASLSLFVLDFGSATLCRFELSLFINIYTIRIKRTKSNISIIENISLKFF